MESTPSKMTNRVNQIIRELNTQSIDSVTMALSHIKEIADLEPEEKLFLAKSLSDVFFNAHHTGATRIPKLAVHIEKRIAKFGPGMIPFLFEEITEADSESVVYFGKTLARIGNPGLEYLLSKLEAYQNRDDIIINLMQVLSYFKIPEVMRAVHPILDTSKHSNHQITSMALYTLGRLVQKMPPSTFSEELRCNIFDSTFSFLPNPRPLVRKNAARTLGKMLRKRLLSEENEKKVYKSFMAMTGRDDHHSWDRAFIVRREADSFLPFFQQQPSPIQRYSQSFKIIFKQFLCANTYYFKIEAPLIARKIEAGHFIIVRPNIYSERIPLSICNWDEEKGTIDIIVSAVGKTTTEINAMEIGDSFTDVVGPLGHRSILPSSSGTCVVVGGGYGTGAIIPTAKDLKEMGNKVIGIVGARSKDSLIMTTELKQVCDEVFITTNDGSQGLGGLVTDALWEVLHRENVIYALAVGPVPMMKAVSEMTRPLNIATYVSLNAIMVDGTGMCGACRVTVGGETKFACFHGPDFDGHKVDFENLIKRQKMFVKEEKLAFASMKV